MSFFSSLFGGSNPTLNAAKTQSGQVAGYGINTGEGLTTSAGNFFSDLMSGDPAKTAKLLAPQIKGAQDRQQQATKTAATFGNRSGGMNAKAQAAGDTTRASITDMVSKLTGQGATQAADLGKSLLDTGITALNQQVNFSQAQMQNWSDSIFGRGLTEASSYALTGGTGGG